jgi:acetyl esterase/lipase
VLLKLSSILNILGENMSEENNTTIKRVVTITGVAIGALLTYCLWNKGEKPMGSILNETTKKFIAQISDQKSSSALTETSVEDFRQFQANLNASLGGKTAPNVITTDDTLQLSNRNVPIRVHRPKNYKLGMPTLLYVAGGAFVTSGLNNIAPTRMTKNCQVIVIGHRLAPEYRIGEIIDDISLGITKLIKNADYFGIKGPIIIGGDSSGASFVLSGMVKLRDTNSPEFRKIDGIVLISPAVDLSMQQQAMKKYDDQDALFSIAAVKAVQNWLKAEDFQDPLVSPIYTPSFKGLPPCKIIVAEGDRLRSHADSLYKKLLRDGVEVSPPYVCKGQVHAFLNLRGVLDEGEDPARVLNKMVTEELLLKPKHLLSSHL